MKNKSLGKRNLLGLTVSTKVGKAVRRNKVRRWMREAYRAYEPKLCCGYYIVLVARICAVDGDYSGISKVIGGMFKRAGLFE
jgi:ribonuclease P protein component